jgi:hypothetical protein
MEKSNEKMPEDVKVINVCDREGDIYELFERAATSDKLFLTRVLHNRTTTDDKKIIDQIKADSPQGNVMVVIPRDSRRNIKQREAVLDITFRLFNIKKPEALAGNKEQQESITATMIYVKERKSNDNIEPIEWILLTNDQVNSLEDAYEKVGYYMQRWKIEQFHFVLKSGCTIEKIQERSFEKTNSLILMYSIIATFIMNLNYISKVNPDLPCTILLDEDEWKILYCAANKTKVPPTKPYSIKDVVKFLGQLGGPKRAPSDGPPGLKIIWLGLEVLHTLLAYVDFF